MLKCLEQLSSKISKSTFSSAVQQWFISLLAARSKVMQFWVKSSKTLLNSLTKGSNIQCDSFSDYYKVKMKKEERRREKKIFLSLKIS